MAPINTRKGNTFTISELAEELDISPSTIRFYEEKGLIKPQRTRGNQRVYAKKHRARLKMILRGKRFGFSLDEIADMIGQEDMEMHEIEQIDRSQRFLDEKLKELNHRKTELDLITSDILSFKDKLAKRRLELEKKQK
ncbi:MAG: MerR family transcriptional regulator [Desulfomonile tiedjei]|nr:MerR family transcriptional regulator [Desulfomonile tiedjei]